MREYGKRVQTGEDLSQVSRPLRKELHNPARTTTPLHRPDPQRVSASSNYNGVNLAATTIVPDAIEF